MAALWMLESPGSRATRIDANPEPLGARIEKRYCKQS